MSNRENPLVAYHNYLITKPEIGCFTQPFPVTFSHDHGNCDFQSETRHDSPGGDREIRDNCAEMEDEPGLNPKELPFRRGPWSRRRSLPLEGESPCRKVARRRVRKMIRELWSSEPEFQIFETPLVVDNVAGVIARA